MRGCHMLDIKPITNINKLSFLSNFDKTIMYKHFTSNTVEFVQISKNATGINRSGAGHTCTAECRRLTAKKYINDNTKSWFLFRRWHVGVQIRKRKQPRIRSPWCVPDAHGEFILISQSFTILSHWEGLKISLVFRTKSYIREAVIYVLADFVR